MGQERAEDGGSCGDRDVKEQKGFWIFSLLVWGRSCDHVGREELRKRWYHFLPV